MIVSVLVMPVEVGRCSLQLVEPSFHVVLASQYENHFAGSLEPEQNGRDVLRAEEGSLGGGDVMLAYRREFSAVKS